MYERMKEELLKEGVLHADETVLQVLKEAGRNANTNSCMWLYRTGGSTDHPLVLYEYQPTRSIGRSRYAHCRNPRRAKPFTMPWSNDRTSKTCIGTDVLSFRTTEPSEASTRS